MRCRFDSFANSRLSQKGEHFDRWWDKSTCNLFSRTMNRQRTKIARVYRLSSTLNLVELYFWCIFYQHVPILLDIHIFNFWGDSIVCCFGSRCTDRKVAFFRKMKVLWRKNSFLASAILAQQNSAFRIERGWRFLRFFPVTIRAAIGVWLYFSRRCL